MLLLLLLLLLLRRRRRSKRRRGRKRRWTKSGNSIIQWTTCSFTVYSARPCCRSTEWQRAIAWTKRKTKKKMYKKTGIDSAFSRNESAVPCNYNKSLVETAVCLLLAITFIWWYTYGIEIDLSSPLFAYMRIVLLFVSFSFHHWMSALIVNAQTHVQAFDCMSFNSSNHANACRWKLRARCGFQRCRRKLGGSGDGGRRPVSTNEYATYWVNVEKQMEETAIKKTINGWNTKDMYEGMG